MTDAVEPFVVDVDDAVIDDLRARLARTRFPDHLTGSGWEYGTPVPYLRDLVAWWRDDYDWRAAEAHLNSFDQYRTRIDGLAIHFLHVRSPHAEATPLLIVHGWPGSVVEFLDVIPRLTHPEDHGGTAGDAFHVVAPSLPGYGFSERPRTSGWDVTRTAHAFAALMDRLGYRRYLAQGGDWGAQITTRLAALDHEHCIGLHVNMALANPPADPGPLTEEEAADLAVMQRFQAGETAYAALQMTRPQTLAPALHDSPAGLASWIIEKFRAWSDCGGDPETVFTRDRLLTNVTCYWVTETYASSARLYWESAHSGALRRPLDYVPVPTGVARYPKEEVLRFPRSWVEQTYNVVHWAVLPRGGHFAAMEQPALFVDDLRTFARTVSRARGWSR